MGLIKAKLTLRNALDKRLAPYEVEALVDTGALLLCLPEHVATQLKLPKLQEREATTADGKTHVCPYVGPVEVSFGNRSCFVGALVLGDDVLLGAVPMEDMDLVISPATQTIEPNPASPNLPSASAKWIAAASEGRAGASLVAGIGLAGLRQLSVDLMLFLRDSS